MRLADILKAIGEHRTIGDASVDVGAVTADSRAASPGSLFAALRGCTVDGHGFAADAATKGCAALLVEKKLPGCGNAVQVIVPDTRSALGLAADAFYNNPSQKLKVVGITGTNGKTTTAYLVKSILEAAGMKTGLIGTIEYVVGGSREKAPVTTPDQVTIHRLLAEMLDAGDSAAVMEVSSHALDQERAAGVRFDTAVFTNLSGDHLDYHTDMESYGMAKAKLFASMQSTAHALINADDPAGELMAQAAACPVESFSAAREADYTVRVASESLDGMDLEMKIAGKEIALHLPLAGRFNAANALAAAAAAYVLGAGTDDIKDALSSFPGVPGRLERVSRGSGPVVFVDYAHTDDALENVLSTLRPLAGGKLITVFGCGGDRDRVKRPRMAAAAERHSDVVVLTSDNPRTEDPDAIMADAEKGFTGKAAYEKTVDRRAAIGRAIELADDGDVVLIAGKGHEDYQVQKNKTIYFDDREVAREFLGKAKKCGT